MAEPSASDHAIPIVREEAFVEKRSVEIEHVRVQTSVVEEQVLVHDSVAREQVEVRRVAMDRQIDAAPAVREEAGVTIIPVVEERLIVEKRLFLVEEIHVSRSSRTEAIELPATLRRTRVDIDRTDLINQQEDVHGRT